jgi:hypothetical protein
MGRGAPRRRPEAAFAVLTCYFRFQRPYCTYCTSVGVQTVGRYGGAAERRPLPLDAAAAVGRSRSCSTGERLPMWPSRAACPTASGLFNCWSLEVLADPPPPPFCCLQLTFPQVKPAPCNDATELTCSGAPGTAAICCNANHFSCGVLPGSGGPRCTLCPKVCIMDCLPGFKCAPDSSGCFNCLPDVDGSGSGFVRSPPPSPPPPRPPPQQRACSETNPCSTGELCASGYCREHPCAGMQCPEARPQCVLNARLEAQCVAGGVPVHRLPLLRSMPAAVAWRRNDGGIVGCLSTRLFPIGPFLVQQQHSCPAHGLRPRAHGPPPHARRPDVRGHPRPAQDRDRGPAHPPHARNHGRRHGQSPAHVPFPHRPAQHAASARPPAAPASSACSREPGGAACGKRRRCGGREPR